MTFGLHSLIALFGLFAVIVPPLIHLLSRRRYKVVDWGAMQFLQLSHTRRRRVLLDELLLMALRMGIIALLVLALAAPFAAGTLVAHLGKRPSRDVVLVVDGSYSMGLDDGRAFTLHDKARQWIGQFLQELSPGDRVSLVHAKHQPIAVLDGFVRDEQQIHEGTRQLAVGDSSCDGPTALRRALESLYEEGEHQSHDVIFLTDGQSFGWTDDDKWGAWRKAAEWLPDQAEEIAGAVKPRLWFVNLSGSAHRKTPSNFVLESLRTASSQAWVGQKVVLKSKLAWTGQNGNRARSRVRVEVDGKTVGFLPVPPPAEVSSDHLPLTFFHTFKKPGSHLVSMILELPTAPNMDCLPADNRVDLALQVQQSVSAVLVDGDDAISRQSSTRFLRQAFPQKMPAGEPPRVRTKVIVGKNLDAAVLAQPLVPDQPESKPRVVVLTDVPKLSIKQQDALKTYIKNGGGVIVVLGQRIHNVDLYNFDLFNNGRGPFPGLLDRPAGDMDKPDKAAVPDVMEFQHPALEIFQTMPGNLERVRFPRWWKVKAAVQHGATVPALLTTGDPMFVEKSYGKGKLLVCTVPLDGAWNTNFHRLPEFVVMAHELIYYMAGSQTTAYTVQPGQPLLLNSNDLPSSTPLPKSAVLVHPDGSKHALTIGKWPFVYDTTEQPGVYRLELADLPPRWYVVPRNRLESDLTTITDEEKEKLQKIVPFRFENDAVQIGRAALDPTREQPLWWLLLLGVVVLLCVEIWFTRRLAKKYDTHSPVA